MVRRMWGFPGLVSIALPAVILLTAWPAAAHLLPHTGSHDLGHPARPVALAFRSGEELTLAISGKRRKLPVADAREVDVERVELAPGAAVAIARIRAGEGSWVAVIGGRSGGELLLLERSDALGDPGERRTREVLTRGTPPRIYTGVRREGVSLCGAEPYLFDAQQIDPNTLQWVRANPLPELVAPSEELTLAALATPSPPPQLSALAASSSSEIDPLTRSPKVPRPLLDGDLQRGVPLEPGGVVVLRWAAGVVPIERLELELGASAKPTELLIFGDGGRSLHASAPASGTPGRVALTFPTPLSSHCLALVNVTAGQAPARELRELRAYTELDRHDGGSARLIGLLVQDGPASAEAAEVLAQLGPEIAEQVAARWPELSERGKRRSLRVFARALDRAAVRARVVELARSPDRQQREAALTLLSRGGEPGRAALRELALAHDAAGDAAALALALARQPEEIATLLAALAREGGASRAGLRNALRVAGRADLVRFREAARAFAAQSPPLASVAALAQVAAPLDPSLTEEIVVTHAARASTFEERHRFVLALGEAAPGPARSEADAWLVQQSGAEEWMQRRAALEALAARGAAQVGPVAEKLAADPYPRVRAAAAASLSAPPLSGTHRRTLLAAQLANDRWPLVRVAAARALGQDAEARPLLEAALADPAPSVRRAAIEALMLQPAAQERSFAPIAERMRDARETVEVREAAVSYARERCVMEARDALVTTARALLAPTADEDTTRLAIEALRALHDLGASAAEAGAAVVKAAETPELDSLWRRLPPARCELRHQS